MVQQFLSADFWLGQPPFSVLHLYLDSCAPSEHTSAFNMQGQAKKRAMQMPSTASVSTFFFFFFLNWLSGSNLPSGLCWLIEFLENAISLCLPAFIWEQITTKLPYITATRITISKRIYFFASALKTWWMVNHGQRRETMFMNMKVGGEKSRYLVHPLYSHCRAAYWKVRLNYSQKVYKQRGIKEDLMSISPVIC